MFYRPGDRRPEALRRNPFKALVAPRPIGWISSLDASGRANLAPYSFFNAVADDPPILIYSNTGRKPDGEGKDSLANIRATGEFCYNLVSENLTGPMNVSTEHYPAGRDEFEAAGLEKAPCEVIACPRVAASPASMECRLWRIVELPGAHNHLVIGEVVGIHIRDEFVHDGIFDVALARPVSRLGYRDYSVVERLFTLARPDD